MMTWGALGEKPVTYVTCQLNRRQYHEIHA